MAQENSAQDPLDFVRGMWNSMGFSLPGMVTPTLDVDELDKRIADLRAVENWLKMNLNMLQMTTQGLEMQRAALAAVRAMSQHVRESDKGEKGEKADKGSKDDMTGEANPFAAAAAMWPWNLMGGQPATPQPAAKPEGEAAEAKPRTGAARKSAGEKKT